MFYMVMRLCCIIEKFCGHIGLEPTSPVVCHSRKNLMHLIMYLPII